MFFFCCCCFWVVSVVSGDGRPAPAQAGSTASPFGRVCFCSTAFVLVFSQGPSSRPMAMTRRSERIFFLGFRFVNTAGLRGAQMSFQGKVSGVAGGTDRCRRWGCLHSHPCACRFACGTGQLAVLRGTAPSWRATISATSTARSAADLVCAT